MSIELSVEGSVTNATVQLDHVLSPIVFWGLLESTRVATDHKPNFEWRSGGLLVSR